MSTSPNDELLSAYVDGELTDPERAEVEAWLTTDAAARHMLDELRAIRDLVGALPHQRLGEDLAARVLEIAERRMLSEPATVVETSPVPLSWTGSTRRFLSRRALTWAALAVGIALMIALANREKSSPVAPAPQVVDRPPREVPQLRPMPGDEKRGIVEGGVVTSNTAKQKPIVETQEQAILLVKCFVRADAPRVALDLLLQQQKIVRDDTERLINTAVDRLGLRAKQTPPAGLVAVDDPRYVYAKANAQQIEGLLAAVSSRGRDFPVLEVEPGQKAQEAWRAYSHGLGVSAQAANAPPSSDTSERLPVLLVVQPVQMAGKK